MVVLDDVLGPDKTVKSEKIGASNLSPLSFTVKVKLNCSFTPTLFLFTEAVNEV